MAMELIETIEVGSGGAASIEFTSIPQDAVDLLLVLSMRTDRAGNSDNANITFNSITGNYDSVLLVGTGSSVNTNSGTGQSNIQVLINGNNDTSNTFSNSELYVSNYAGSSNKSWSTNSVNENNAALAFQRIKAGAFTNTAAVSSMQLSPNSGSNFLQYSTASLYKIS